MGSGLKQTIEWYNKNAKLYDVQSSKYSSLAQINDFVRLLPPKAKILDAGCGSGRDSDLLVKKSLEVIGLDLSTSLISLAKIKYPNIKFVVGNFLDLPFPNNSFNGVWAHASLVHLESVADVKKALKEFNRVLKSTGVIHVLVKANNNNERFEVVGDKLTGNSKRFFQYFRKEELKSLIEEIEFNIIKLYEFRDIYSEEKYFKPLKWILCLAKKNK
jgi:ubiquinone/menaquinone biosynthesis C-methylase UbiE